MAMPNLDPRTGGACCKFIAKKFFSVVVGWVQLVMFIIAFFTVVFSPSTVPTLVKLDTTATVIAGFLLASCIAFSVILLIGLHKNARLYVKAYCIFITAHIILLILSFFINIFVQPQNIGFRGFISLVISILLELVFVLVVRSYYLITYCNGDAQVPYQNKV